MYVVHPLFKNSGRLRRCAFAQARATDIQDGPQGANASGKILEAILTWYYDRRNSMKKESRSTFEKAADSRSGGNFAGDFWDFIKTNRKWWLLPMVVLLLGFGVLILLSSTGIAPFIYTLF
jgi:hypothetical protein